MVQPGINTVGLPHSDSTNQLMHPEVTGWVWH